MTIVARPDQPRLRTVSLGPRIGARLLDGVFALIAYAGVGWLVWSIVVRRVIDTGGIIGGLVGVAWVVLSVWALFGKGARLAGVLLGQRWVTVPDGEKSGGRLLGKFLAQAGIGLVTLGLGEALISVLSARSPDRRTWFDRITGLRLVSPDHGPAPAAPPAEAPVQQVHSVGFPGFGAGTPGSPPQSSAAPVPAAGQQAWPAGTSGKDQPPIASVGASVHGGFVDSTPWSKPSADVAVPPPPALPDRHVEVVPLQTRLGTPSPPPGASGPVAPAAAEPAAPAAPAPAGAAPASDQTVLAPHAGIQRTLWLRLDDSSRLDLDNSVVIGRDPLLPPDLATATPLAMTDPTMQLSKTHVALGIDPGGVWVVDLYSTNGVSILPMQAAEAVPVPPGQLVVAGPGARIRFGGRWAEVCHD